MLDTHAKEVNVVHLRQRHRKNTWRDGAVCCLFHLCAVRCVARRRGRGAQRHSIRQNSTSSWARHWEAPKNAALEEGEREGGLASTEHLLHPHSLYQALLFAFDQMFSWYSPAEYGWYGSYGSWYGRRRGSWGGKSEVRSDVEWFCQKCGTGNWWSRTDCRHCASFGSDDGDIPQSSTQEKISVPEKTLAGMGDDEPILAGKKVLEKELEKLQRSSMARRKRQSTSRPNKIGSTQNPNVSRRNLQG